MFDIDSIDPNEEIQITVAMRDTCRIMGALEALTLKYPQLSILRETLLENVRVRDSFVVYVKLMKALNQINTIVAFSDHDDELLDSVYDAVSTAAEHISGRLQLAVHEAKHRYCFYIREAALSISRIV